MTLIIDLLLWTIVVALGLAVVARSQSLFVDCCAPGRASMRCCRARHRHDRLASLPDAAAASDPVMVRHRYGPGPHHRESVAGALTPGGPVVGFAIAAAAFARAARAPRRHA